ncbi:MAG TPA: hypothetical protein VF658_17420 [Pyrinomonadaceae bacterium]|jgi:hypothetical protein
MNSRPLAGWLALALLFGAAHAAAQTPAAQASTEQQRKAKKELEQKALGLLDDIIKEAQSFKVVENRLRLKAFAASLLWKYDEARARTLFKETLNGIVDLLNNQDEDEAQTTRLFLGAPQLRREVVQMLSAHDARMARDFLRATQPSASSPGRYGEPDSDLQIEYTLATQIIETDPKQALEIAEDSLAKGFSYELINTLKQLQAKDPEAAAKLAGDIVTKLRSEKLTTNQEAANVAFNLLNLVFNSADESTNKDAKKAEPLLSQQGMRELMEINVNLALNSPSYLGRLQALGGMMEQVEKYAPTRVAELRRKMAQNKKTMSGEDGEEAMVEPPEWAQFAELMEKGTGDELLAAAAKAPREMRENLYQAAAAKFAEQGEIDRAREIINSHVADSPYRKQILAELERQTSLTAAEQGKMDQVRKTLANLKTNEERAITLAQVATVLTAKGEKKLARQLLEEAQGMVNYRAKNVKQLGAQLTVAQAYVKLEPERSLAMLEPIVDHLNELLAAAVTLGGFFIGEEVMRDDEIRMEVFSSLVPMFSIQHTPDLKALASFDFDRTRALADRFQRDEVKMMARLLIVQSVLAEQGTPAQQLRGRMTTTTTRTMDVEPPITDEPMEEGDTP